MEKSEQEVFLSGSTPTIIPLVFEHFGHWGKSAELFLQELANNTKAIGDTKTTVEFLTDWI